MVSTNESTSLTLGEKDDLGIAFQSELRALVVVAHPDDETLWMGGTMLMNPDWNWHVVSLCRGQDRDRRPRFFGALTCLGARGSIGEMDDGPEQRPLADAHVQHAILAELEDTNFDLIVTHSPFGEYTRHRMHEEVGRAMLHLWKKGEVTAKELWMFAYSDSKKTHYPRAIEDAHLNISLPKHIWKTKLAIIQDVYGFAPDSWEAMTTPKKEAFWRFNNTKEALAWYRRFAPLIVPDSVPATKGRGEKNESSCSV